MPTIAEMRADGWEPEDFEAEDPVEVWPENWQAFTTFMRLRTQWLLGPGGPIGLNYVPLFSLMDRLGLQGREWDDFLSDVQALEEGALDQIAKNKPPG
ncbi:DUF1799 domain-containing protein [Hydrogenophaga atypica]|uniref:DUF1799 domain-containing protein n=1 Tax=Hydrogenophaga atypica TaxID=249409 RepID=A0ABW2QGZ6_9BURK